MKVIVIDDDPIVLEVVRVTLQDLGHDVTTRTSAMGASALILRERPDLVLVDINMPALPGDEWLELVTDESLAAGDGHEPAFVVFSSKSVEELERVVRETCAVGYIHKQGGPEAFDAAFEKIVQGLGS